jgi:hypothetical protein
MALPSSDTTTTVPHRRSFTTSPPQPTTPYVSIRRSRIFVTKLRELSQAHVHESLQEQQRRQQQEQQLKHRQEQQRQQQRQREKSGKPLRTAFLQPIQTFLLDWAEGKALVHESLQEQQRRQQQEQQKVRPEQQQQQEKSGKPPRAFPQRPIQTFLLDWAEGTTAHFMPVCGGGGCKYTVPCHSQHTSRNKQRQQQRNEAVAERTNTPDHEANSVLEVAATTRGQDQPQSTASASTTNNNNNKKKTPSSSRLQHQESLRDFIFGTNEDGDAVTLSFDDESRLTTTDGEDDITDLPPGFSTAEEASSLYTTDDSSYYSYSFDDTTTISTWNSRHNATTIAHTETTTNSNGSGNNSIVPPSLINS